MCQSPFFRFFLIFFCGLLPCCGSTVVVVAKGKWYIGVKILADTDSCRLIGGSPEYLSISAICLFSL